MNARIEVQLLSDTTFSVGSGTAGEVDVEIARDRLGLPMLPAKTLRGLLRDAWLSMAGCFEAMDPVVREVLGASKDLTPGGGSVVRIADAVLSDESRSWVEFALNRSAFPMSPEELFRAFTGIRRQTAIDEATGTALGETLRASRVAIRELKLIAPVELMKEGGGYLEALALCCLGVRHAGAGRNRGRGHVRLRLQGEPSVDLTEKLAHRLRRGESLGGA